MRNIAVNVALIAACLTGCQSKQVLADMANCAKVKSGMSPQDVQAIMGHSVTEHVPPGNLGMFLYYSEPRMASGPITIHFAKSGDRYRVDYAECKGQE